MERENPIRTFIAIEIGDEMQRALAEAQTQLKQRLYFSSFRWTAPTGVHITLKFLGDVLPSKLDAIQTALDGIAGQHTEFHLSAENLGVFPNANRPSVLWVGLQGELAQLHRLRDDVERVIAPLGYPTERRPFSPHLTLARIKEPSAAEVAALRETLRDDPVGLLGEIGVSELVLMRSDLSSGGARYTRLASFDLSE